MKRYLLVLVLLLPTLIFAQQTFYTISSGSWDDNTNWTLSLDEPTPSRDVPSAKDEVIIRHDINQWVQPGHIHAGNVRIEESGSFSVFSGYEVSQPYIFAGDTFDIYGSLYTSSDFHHQIAGSDGNGVLIFRETANVWIGDDLILNANSTTYMQMASCGSGLAEDDIYFQGPGVRLEGMGNFVVTDAIRSFDEFGGYTGVMSDPMMQTNHNIAFYKDLEDCENGENPVLIGSNPTSFPVEWLAFDAYQKGNSIELSWLTATEQNNDYFTIERSTDGVSFEAIAEIDGAGTTDTHTSYSMVDRNAKNGVNIYRLRQTDFDGEFSYSPLVEVTFEALASKLNFYPNPVVDQVNIDLRQFTTNDRVDISIYNMQGQLVAYETMGGGFVSEMNLSKLPTANYVIRLVSGKTVEQSMLIKQ